MKRVISLMLLAGSLSAAATYPKTKLSRDLVATAPTASVRVIVQWMAGVRGTRQKIQALGGSAVFEYVSIHAGTYVVPQAALKLLDMDPDVKFVSIDRQVKRKLAVAAATINAPAVWASGFIGTGIGVAVIDSGVNQDSNLAAPSISGNTPAIVQSRTPIANREPRINSPVYVEDFVNPVLPGESKPASYGVDWYGHGQHVAGIIASNGKASKCAQCTEAFVGIAPGANIIDLKVLDANGEGTDSGTIAAIDRAIGLKKTYNIRVINLSLGRPVFESYTEDPICQAVEAAWKAGIVVVVAAGNDGRDNSFGNEGYGTITAPGNDPYVITVGAMKSVDTASRADDTVASYSSKGPTSIDQIVKPDIVAPGNRIISLLAEHGTLAMQNPQNLVTLSTYESQSPKVGDASNQPDVPTDPETQPGGATIPSGYSPTYYILSGTSMAAAVVSGSVADVLQAYPGLTPDQVKILLMQTATKTFPIMSTVVDPDSSLIFTSYYDIFTIGAGYLDLKAAMASASEVPAGLTSLSPVAHYDGTTGDVTLSFDPSWLFANKAIWGTTSIWSNAVLAGNKAIWGTSALWGAATDSSQKALWGTGAIWSTKAIWGTSTFSASENVAIGGEE